MITHEHQLKQLLASFRALESQARRNERDAKVEAEAYQEAAMRTENAIYEAEKMNPNKPVGDPTPTPNPPPVRWR